MIVNLAKVTLWLRVIIATTTVAHWGCIAWVRSWHVEAAASVLATGNRTSRTISDFQSSTWQMFQLVRRSRGESEWLDGTDQANIQLAWAMAAKTLAGRVEHANPKPSVGKNK